MKTTWIVKSGHPDLLLFFNGWGMDAHVAAHVQSATTAPWPYDLLVFSDYRDLSLPDGMKGVIDSYRSIDLVAWSLGVWAASHAGLDRVGRAVAINGTLFPADDRRGIPPDIFRATLDSYSDKNRTRFERRMYCGGELDERFDALRSHRTTEDQRGELFAIAEALRSLPGPGDAPWRYSRAVIGDRDLVFSPRNQLEAWKEKAPATVREGMPHFPFFTISGWKEVLS